MSWLKIASVLLLMANQVYSKCPRDCQCYPLHGIVTCKNRVFKEEMFNDVPRDTEQLYLSNCNITFPIGPKTFKNFTQLVYLYLDNEPTTTTNLWNKVTSIGAGTFAHLKRLRLLSLANIQLKTIDSNTLQGLTGLEKLMLDDNHLTAIPKYVFRDLTNLQELQLGYNRLPAIAKDTLNDLVALKYLNLSNNEISTIDGISHIKTLQQLVLSGNKMTTVGADLLQGLDDLREISLDDNQLTTIEKGAFNTLSSISTIEIKSNQNLQCSCDFLSYIWKHIHSGRTAEIQCSSNGHQINTENNKQMSDQDVTKVNCAKSSSWASWGTPEECRNYQIITRRTCIGNFTIPQCNGSSVKRKPCHPLTYSNYSKASGDISFYNLRQFNENVGVASLAEAMARDEKDFLKKLSTSIKYLLYAGQGFAIKSVDIVGIKLAPINPPVNVQYEVTMERTTKTIWQTNPVSSKKTISPGDFELDTDPSYSTIQDYDECALDSPCHKTADCIIVKENFNFGCQCQKHMKGNGFYCFLEIDEKSPKPQKPSQNISIAAVACIVVGIWVLVILIVVFIRYRSKRASAAAATTTTAKKPTMQQQRKYLKPQTQEQQQPRQPQRKRLQQRLQQQKQKPQPKQQQTQELRDMTLAESHTDYGSIGQDNQEFQFTAF